MSVNKYQLRIDGEDKYINIPLTLTSTNVGQSDIIEHEFVKKETEKAINPIIDHEKIRFKPRQEGFPIGRVDYNINLLKGGVFPSITTYGSEGFENDDIKFKRNNFKRSFLNLTFFDSDTTTNQNYLGNITIFSKITRFDLKPTQITKPKPFIKPISYQSLEALEGNYTNTLNNFLDGGDYNMVHYEDTIEVGNFNFNLISNNADTFEPVESCGFTKATYDDGIGNTVSIGHVCTNYLFPQMMKYYVSGLSWKRVITPGDDHPECSTNGMLGELRLFSGEEGDIPFGGYYLVTSNYEYQGKTYEVYVEWLENVYTKTSVVNNVYFKCVSGDGASGTPVGGESTSSLLPNIQFGQVQDVNNIPLRFIVEDPISTPKGFAEGYYVYHEKTHTPPSIYMRATFNNAKNGLSTDLITTDKPQDIDNVVNKLHMKYDLKYGDDIYYYELDMKYRFYNGNY